MLDLDDYEARKVWASPLFVELMRVLLNDAVVTRELEAIVVIGFQIRVGRLFAKAPEVCGKVSVKNNERIMRFGMRVETLRQ